MSRFPRWAVSLSLLSTLASVPTWAGTATLDIDALAPDNSGFVTATITSTHDTGGGIEVHLSDYNLFLLGDYSEGHDVQGKVAAGGNITLTDFSMGAGLPASDIANALVAGGTLALSRGGVWGDAWYGSGYSSNTSVSFPRGTVSHGTPIDFTARFTQLRSLSSQLGGLAANGTTTLEGWGGIMLRGTDAAVNVFQVNASSFTGAKLLSIDAPAGALAVVNIHGASASFSGFGISFSGGIDQHGVLYNFVDATSIHAHGFGFWGTVLAPYADITFNDGSWDGGIYAKSLSGNAEGHINALNSHVVEVGCQSYPAAVLSDGPAGYWRLDDSPGTAIMDSSGNEVTGAVAGWSGFGASGLITHPGDLAGAFGSGGIRLPTERLNFEGSQGLTVEAWARTTSGGAQLIFSQQSCSQRTLQLWVSSGRAVFRLVGYRDDGSAIWDQQAYGHSNVADGLPHHLVGVRDLATRTISIYVDGVFEGSVPDETQTSGPLIGNIETWIGRRPWCGQTNEFNGIIDEVAVYRKALPPERIATHHRTGRCAVGQ